MDKIKDKIKKSVKKLLPGHLPDFLIVGAQKAATTSLHYYLNQHPQIIGSRPKEVGFFDRHENYERGLNWYLHNFPNTKNPFRKFKYFEATPEYLYRSYVPKRICMFNENIKIIIVLRDPVQRAYSAWCMYRAFGKRKKLPDPMFTVYVKNGSPNLLKEFYQVEKFPDFETVVEEDIRKYLSSDPLEEPSIVRRGLYYDQVNKFINLFGKEKVLILGFKDVVGVNKVEYLNKILEFINLPHSDWKFLKDEPKNSQSLKDEIPAGVIKKLEGFYEPNNVKLFDLIGFKPNW